MKSTVVALVAGTGLLIVAAPAPAHHSFAAVFDRSKPVKFTGTVTKVEWSNPHVWFYVDVKDDVGNITNWAFELTNPNMLMRSGWTKTSLKSGDAVIGVDGDAVNSATSLVGQIHERRPNSPVTIEVVRDG